ncbi:hypothetical protein PG999_014054 [Apiospora kogelbergensis]|uniref:Uncharacterized protein n=1 Tax=Apiospora kogelbergensis TaxID=1337665 RepID=A0AAW0Q9Z1_9PEZI
MQFNYLILLAGVAASVAGSPITDVEDASVATNDSSPNNSNVCIVSTALRIRWNFNLTVNVNVNVNSGSGRGGKQPKCPSSHKRFDSWTDSKKTSYKCCSD